MKRVWVLLISTLVCAAATVLVSTNESVTRVAGAIGIACLVLSLFLLAKRRRRAT